MPFNAAGTRPEPAVSVPTAKATTPARDRHAPTRARPARRSGRRRRRCAGAVRACGCRSARWRTGRGWSCRRGSRPRRAAGATAGASTSGDVGEGRARRGGRQAATSMLSLIANGTPYSGRPVVGSPAVLDRGGPDVQRLGVDLRDPDTVVTTGCEAFEHGVDDGVGREPARVGRAQSRDPEDVGGRDSHSVDCRRFGDSESPWPLTPCCSLRRPRAPARGRCGSRWASSAARMVGRSPPHTASYSRRCLPGPSSGGRCVASRRMLVADARRISRITGSYTSIRCRCPDRATNARWNARCAASWATLSPAAVARSMAATAAAIASRPASPDGCAAAQRTANCSKASRKVNSSSMSRADSRVTRTPRRGRCSTSPCWPSRRSASRRAPVMCRTVG